MLSWLATKHASCYIIYKYIYFTITVDFICLIPFFVQRTFINREYLQELNFNFQLSYKESKLFSHASANCKSSVRTHLIYLYLESQKQLEVICGI